MLNEKFDSMEDGLVSVIIPTYNRPAAAVRSIESALNQTYDNIEVIAVDDASDDDTWEQINTIEDSRLITAQHPANRGGNAARNTGIKHASGEILAFLDSDDTWDPEKIRRQVDFYRNNNYSAIYCDIRPIFGTGARRIKNNIKSFVTNICGGSRAKPSGGEELIPLLLIMKFPLGGSSTLMIHHGFLDSIGRWDEDLRRHQDWELLVRILKNGTIGYLDQVLVNKYATGGPSYELYFHEKKKFLKKYAEDVVLAELNGVPVTSEHHFGLVKHALRNGKWESAVEHLRISDVRHPGRILLLLQPLIHGYFTD